MTKLFPSCINCGCEYTYEDANSYICPECSCEWQKTPDSKDVEDEGDSDPILDANGVALSDGDTVVVIKDLKVKGSSSVVKVGTRVKNIRLVGGDHDIDCKIAGIGSMKLKSEFVRKA